MATYAQVSFTQMKIHWWQGKIEVHQIKVRDTYTVERLECRIPWRHLFSVPTKLKLEGVSILRPKASEANETKGVAAVSAAAAAGAAAGAAAAEAKKNAKEIPQQVSGWPRKQRKLVIDDLVGKWLSIVDVRIENMSVDIGHEGSKLTIQNCHTVPLCYPFITSAKQDLSRELRIENISYDNWFRMPQSKTVIIGTWDGIRIDFKVSSLEARNIPRGIFTIQKHSSSSPTIAVMGTPIALSLDVAQMHTSIDDFTPELKLSGASVKLYVSHGPTKLSVACQDIQLLDSDAKCPPWSIQNVSYQPTQDLLSIRTVNIVQPLLWIPTLTEIGRFFATSSASPSDSRVVTATKLGQAAHSRPLAGKLMIDRLIVKHEQWSLEMENAMFVLKSKMFSFDTIQLLVAAPSVSISHLDQKHSTGKQVGPPIWSKLQKHDTLMALKHGMVLVKEWPISFVGQESDSSLLLKGGSEETTVLVEETSAWNLFLEGLALQSNLEDVRKFERIWTQDPHVTFRLKELLVTASQFNYRRLQYELVPSLRSFYNKTTASVKVDPFRAKSVATPFSNYHIRIAKVQIELEQLPLISSQEINRYFLLGVGSHPYLCFRGRSLTLQTGAQSAMVASSSMQTDTENVASELTRSVQTDPMVDRWHAVIFGGNSRNNLYKQRVGIWLDQLQWQCTSEAIQKWVAIPAFFQPPSGLVVPTLPVHSTTNEFSLHKTLDHVAGKSMYCFLHISKCNVMLAKRMYRIHVPVMSASSMILPETDAPLSACIRTDIQLLDHNDHILAEASNMDCLACIRPKGQWDLKFQRKTGAGVALALSKFQVETMIEQLAIYTRTNSTPARAAADAADTKDTRAQLFAPPSPGQDNYFASLKPSMEDDLVSGDSSLLFYDDVIRIEDEYLVDSNVSIPVALGAVAPATLAERKATVAAETARSRDEQLTVGWYAPPLIVDNHLARVFPHEDANDVATLPTVVNGKEQLSKFLLPDTIPMQAIGLADWKCSVRLLDESRKCFARAEGVGVNIEWRKWGETSQWITCRVQSLDLIDECVSSNYNKVLTCWVGFRDEKQRPLHFVQPASAPMLQWEILQQPSSNNSPHDMRRVVESNTIVSVAGSAGQPAIVELAPSVEQKNQELYSSGLSVKVKIAPLRLHLHQDFLHQILYVFFIPAWNVLSLPWKTHSCFSPDNFNNSTFNCLKFISIRSKPKQEQ